MFTHKPCNHCSKSYYFLGYADGVAGAMDNVTYIYHEHTNDCYSKCYIVAQTDGGYTSWYGECPECGVYNTIDSHVTWSYVYSCGYKETLFVMGMCENCGEHIYPEISNHSCTYATCGKTEATLESISFN